MWPSRLCDDGPLSASSSRDPSCLSLDIRACLVRCHVSIEKGVAVCRTVIRRLAELGILNHRIERVDRDDGTSIARSSKSLTRGIDGADNLRRGILSLVDKFVSNGNCVEEGPIAIGSIDQRLKTPWEIVQVEDPGEDLHVVFLCCIQDGGHLVAVHAIDADKRIIDQFFEISIDFALGFAGAVGIVRRICDADFIGRNRAGWYTLVRRR